MKMTTLKKKDKLKNEEARKMMMTSQIKMTFTDILLLKKAQRVTYLPLCYIPPLQLFCLLKKDVQTQSLNT